MPTAQLAKDAARPTTLAEVRDLTTLPVHSTTDPSAAGLLNLTRWHAYKAAKNGDMPGVLRIGGRLLVSVPALRRALGDLPAEMTP